MGTRRQVAPVLPWCVAASRTRRMENSYLDAGAEGFGEVHEILGVLPGAKPSATNGKRAVVVLDDVHSLGLNGVRRRLRPRMHVETLAGRYKQPETGHEPGYPEKELNPAAFLQRNPQKCKNDGECCNPGNDNLRPHESHECDDGPSNWRDA